MTITFDVDIPPIETTSEPERPTLMYGQIVRIPRSAIDKNRIDGGELRELTNTYGPDDVYGRVQDLSGDTLTLHATTGGVKSDDAHENIYTVGLSVKIKDVVVAPDVNPPVQRGDIIKPLAMSPYSYIKDGFVDTGEVTRSPYSRQPCLTAKFIGKDGKEYTRTVHMWTVERRSTVTRSPEAAELADRIREEITRRKREKGWCNVTDQVVGDLGLSEANYVRVEFVVNLEGLIPSNGLGITLQDVVQEVSRRTLIAYPVATITPYELD